MPHPEPHDPRLAPTGAPRRGARGLLAAAALVALAAMVVGAAPAGGRSATAGSAVQAPAEAPTQAPTQDGAGDASPAAPADPAQVRDDVREVMGREEFSYEKSWMDRFGEWLSDRLGDLFPESSPSTGGSFGGGIGSIIAYLMILLAVAGVVAAIVYVVVRNITKVERDVDEDPTPTEIEHRRAASAWRSEALDHEAAGEWKLAIRARYRELVRTLTDRRQLPDVAGRTTRELRADLSVTTPDAADAFDTASLLFELPWYADVATGPDENERFRSAAEVVLGAPAQDTFDDVVPAIAASAATPDELELRA